MFNVKIETLVVIAINLMVCLFVVFFRLQDGDSHLINVLLMQSIAIFTLVVMHSVAWFRQGGSDMSLAYLFFLMVFIFNVGKALLFLFFFDKHNEFFNFFIENDYQVVVRAYEYGYVGLLVLSTAMLLSQNQQEPQEVIPNDIEMTAIKLTSIIFLAVSLPAAVIDLKTMLMQVLSGGYFALYSGEQSYGAAGILKVLAFFLFPALYISVIAFRSNKRAIYSILIFAGFYSAVKLAMGARLAALIPFLILLSLWDVSIKHVSRKMIYVSAVSMIAVVFPALSLLRVGGELDQNTGVGHAIFEIIKEMSDSMSPLVWIMQRVPGEFDYIYGHSFLLAISTAIPNLFWDVHPAKSGSLALWLVHEVNPWIAKAGGGYGFSIFAEMYLNFYWLGMIPLFLVGIFITRFSIVKANPINTAFCFACFFGLMLWPRGEAVAVGRFILWNVGIPWLFYRGMIFAIGRFR
jgi:oligosaccharide repeat unit polymerase